MIDEALILQLESLTYAQLHEVIDHAAAQQLLRFGSCSLDAFVAEIGDKRLKELQARLIGQLKPKL